MVALQVLGGANLGLLLLVNELKSTKLQSFKRAIGVLCSFKRLRQSILGRVLECERSTEALFCRAEIMLTFLDGSIKSMRMRC